MKSRNVGTKTLREYVVMVEVFLVLQITQRLQKSHVFVEGCL